MAGLASALFPGHPHHLTQRNGRGRTFFEDAAVHFLDVYRGASAGIAGLVPIHPFVRSIGRPIYVLYCRAVFAGTSPFDIRHIEGPE